MPANPLLKYKIGLAVLAIFCAGLLAMVVPKASATKQDSTAFQQASDIADKLNSYVNNKYAVPESLQAAGIKNVPAAVSYKKLSSSKYRFCVTYKSTSSGFDASSAESSLLSAAAGSPVDTSLSSSSSSAETTLFLDSNHHKGQNCQTVDAQVYNPNNVPLPVQGSLPGKPSASPAPVANPTPGGGSANSSDPYAACDSIVDNNAYTQCLDNVSKTQSTPN